MNWDVDKFLENTELQPLCTNPYFQKWLETGTYTQRFGSGQVSIVQEDLDWFVKMFRIRQPLYIRNWLDDPKWRLNVITGTIKNPNFKFNRTITGFFQLEVEKDRLYEVLSSEEWSLFDFDGLVISLRVKGESLTDDQFYDTTVTVLYRLKKEMRCDWALSLSHRRTSDIRFGVKRDIVQLNAHSYTLEQVNRFKELFAEIACLRTSKTRMK